MFIASDAPRAEFLRPSDSNITQQDWNVLSDFWYPVALEADLGAEPTAVKLLDVELVLFRGESGAPVLALNVCPHRHVRLSAGEVVDGQIVCPFHGLRFNEQGRCTRVPALGRETRLPASYCVRTFPAQVHYGLIWTCLGDPDKHPMPRFPGMEMGEHIEIIPAMDWPVSAPRQVENFFDLAHLPYVHEKTLGGDQFAKLTPGLIEHDENGLTMHTRYVETAHGVRHCSYIYRVVLPFAIEYTVIADEDADHSMHSCDLPCPVSAHECKVFQLLTIKGDAETAKTLSPFLAGVNAEDIEVLRQLRLQDLPLDQHHEIHLPVDNISNAYRTRLRELGLGK